MSNPRLFFSKYDSRLKSMVKSVVYQFEKMEPHKHIRHIDYHIERPMCVFSIALKGLGDKKDQTES
ncbi:MAG TPA: hypothetical protein VFP97_17945, partial [Chitinophagaceae bacterium]|nr:hypothetical protein [Chitinophagaceae bacterium]